MMCVCVCHASVLAHWHTQRSLARGQTCRLPSPHCTRTPHTTFYTTTRLPFLNDTGSFFFFLDGYIHLLWYCSGVTKGQDTTHAHAHPMKKQKKIEIPQRAQKDDRFLNDYISAYYDSNFNNKFKTPQK
mmetsp:Transcript_22664/g.33366  ORF Transcript_22664/g.33366 Transcript_22664/m.33366 type:complete len:129 (+) Transcript_22664:477-863(+)